MAKISDIQSIIANLSNNSNINTVQYPTKPVEEKKPEVHDVKPVTVPSYNVANAAPTEEKKEENNAGRALTSSISASMLPDKSAVDAFVKRLVPGTDIMSIPGITKPILTKSGAVKVIKFFGLRTSITLLDKHVDPANSFISYTFKVSAITSDGICLYEAVGSSNSDENKFKGKGMAADSMLAQMAIKRATVGLAMWLLIR